MYSYRMKYQLNCVKFPYPLILHCRFLYSLNCSYKLTSLFEFDFNNQASQHSMSPCRIYQGIISNVIDCDKMIQRNIIACWRNRPTLNAVFISYYLLVDRNESNIQS